jgi:predicted O-linked N-acetylglucosamine transferase (SPINDLY family)
MDTIVIANKLFERGTLELSIDVLLQSISKYDEIISSVSLLDYLLIDKETQFSKKGIVQCLLNMGLAYKYIFELCTQSKMKESQRKMDTVKHTLSDQESNYFDNSLKCFRTVLDLSVDNGVALQEIASLYSVKSVIENYNYQACLKNCKESLWYDPLNSCTHYNIGFIYLRLNNLNESLYHYKLAVKLSEPESNMQIILNSYYGISCIYKTVQKWTQALYYLLRAKSHSSKDPDINNQLGVVYTELRRTDLAEKCYQIAEDNYTSAVISTDKTFLLAEILLNRGHMNSYNGNTLKSISYYNKSLSVHPKFLLPFQNKIMNLNYLFDEFSDTEYIYKQHKLVEKIIPSSTFKLSGYNTVGRKRIGFVSGDFVDHPVYYFISCLLSCNSLSFDIYCYSEKVITNSTVKHCVIKNVSDEDLRKQIISDKIDVLIDLSGHTAMNRMGLFALRAAPVQMTYIGYPNTTGLKNMDYRITDTIADQRDFKPERYTEKLLFLDRCFLCYTPMDLDLGEQPFIKNGFITFGSFNRLNKITAGVKRVWESLLKGTNHVIVCKTKALLNESKKNEFLESFDEIIRSRIIVVPCTVTHQEHLMEYNGIDIALDTFSYSGTTTSCEALSMGVPVLTLRDNTNYFHAQNVTSSILHYSGMGEYILNDPSEFKIKCDEMTKWDVECWKNLKVETRNKFIGGNVCDPHDFISKFTKSVLQAIS